MVGLGLVMGSGGVLRVQPQPADERPSLAVLPFDDRPGNEGSWWGDLLGVEYFLVGAVTEYGRTGESFVAAANARIIDAQTGEILWADEARVSIRGFGGGDRGSRFDEVMKPIVHELTASIESADL